jgi:adenosylcobyric acid synthase
VPRRLLASVATVIGRSDWLPCPDTVFAARREARLEALADAVERHLDTGVLEKLLGL